MGAQIGVSRRQLLVAALSGLVAACTPRRSPRPDITGPPATLSPSAQVDPALNAALGRETLLIELYAQAVTLHPSLRTELSAVLGHHRAHVARLTSAGGSVPLPAPGASHAAPSPQAPRDPGVLLTSFARLESTSVDADVSGAAEAQRGDTSVLLAEIAASHAQHAAALGALHRARLRARR